ncbi:MAG: NAD(P)H-dependent oxidoreductase subunit E [candidate division Zixibacteria bacterium]|nr:NAD(P)H-dependent oxidoreductase subunit E [candidate division Zixibacteria bacterium]
MEGTQVQDIIEKHEQTRGGLIAILEGIQNRYGYLSEDSLRTVAEKTGRSLVDIYAVATFYKAFSLKPRGKHLISACLGTACHVRGGPAIAEEIQRQLGVEAGETTPDGEFTFETAACLGACALGPIVVVDGHYYSKVGTVNVKNILKEALLGPDEDDIKRDERIFRVEVNCPQCNHSLMDVGHLIDGEPSVRLTASFHNKHTPFRFSSLYGSGMVESEEEVPVDTIINFFCPHCHAELVGASNCADCGALMVPLIVRSGGMIQICSRRGCKNHMLDLDGENL